MLHLLQIDLKKLTSYRTFWVVCGLYFLTIGFSTASGMEFLKWLASTFDKFGSSLNINRIPFISLPGCMAEPGLVEWVFQGSTWYYGCDIDYE